MTPAVLPAIPPPPWRGIGSARLSRSFVAAHTFLHILLSTERHGARRMIIRGQSEGMRGRRRHVGRFPGGRIPAWRIPLDSGIRGDNDASRCAVFGRQSPIFSLRLPIPSDDARHTELPLLFSFLSPHFIFYFSFSVPFSFLPHLSFLPLLFFFFSLSFSFLSLIPPSLSRFVILPLPVAQPYGTGHLA